MWKANNNIRKRFRSYTQLSEANRMFLFKSRILYWFIYMQQYSSVF